MLGDKRKRVVDISKLMNENNVEFMNEMMTLLHDASCILEISNVPDYVIPENATTTVGNIKAMLRGFHAP